MTLDSFLQSAAHGPVGCQCGIRRVPIETKGSAVGILDAKRLLITGVLPDQSLAFAVARLAQEEGAVSPKLLSSGIYEAMITTASGLFVGIIAYLSYNYLVAKVEKLIHNMEYSSIEFLDILQEKRLILSPLVKISEVFKIGVGFSFFRIFPFFHVIIFSHSRIP